MRRKLIAPMLVLLPCLIFTSCDDEPPPGLIQEVMHALMGRLLGCPTGQCSHEDELNIGLNDTPDQLQKDFNLLTANWCPVYTLKTEKIERRVRGTFKQGQQYTISLAGFGQITIKSKDFTAQVEADDAGWKTTVVHNHEEYGKNAQCPATYPAQQCKVKLKLTVESDGEISVSWIDHGATKTASGASKSFMEYAPATASEFCEKKPDGRKCGLTETPAGAVQPPKENETPSGKTESQPPKTESKPPKQPKPGETPGGTPKASESPGGVPAPAPPTDRSVGALQGKPQIFAAGEASSGEQMLVTVRGTNTIQGVVVSAEANGQKTEAVTDSNGQTVLSVAAIAGGVTAAALMAVRALDQDGHELAHAQTRITPGPPAVTAPPDVPNLGLLPNGGTVTIPGHNLGPQCRLVLGNRAQETLSASSKEMTSFIDAPTVGPQAAYVQNANGSSPTQTVHCYNFSIKAPQTTIVRGQRIVASAAYEGLPPGSRIEFTNATPGIVRVRVVGASQNRGAQSVFRVTQSAGSCDVELIGKGKGEWAVTYRVLAPE